MVPRRILRARRRYVPPEITCRAIASANASETDWPLPPNIRRKMAGRRQASSGRAHVAQLVAGPIIRAVELFKWLRSPARNHGARTTIFIAPPIFIHGERPFSTRPAPRAGSSLADRLPRSNYGTTDKRNNRGVFLSRPEPTTRGDARVSGCTEGSVMHANVFNPLPRFLSTGEAIVR